MGNEVKRMRYFDGLFLKADEFNLEQNYHIRMRRLHNRHLHTWGIAWGLEVVQGPGNKQVTVKEGMALNKVSVGGEEVSQEIFLASNSQVDLSSYNPKDGVYIYILRDKDKEVDVVEEKGGTKEIHWLEGAVIKHDMDKPTNESENIILAKVIIKDDNTIDASSIYDKEDDNPLRRYAGFSGKVLETEKLTLAISGVTSGLASIEGKKFGALNGIQINSAMTNFAGPLNVEGNVGIGTTDPENAEGWSKVLDILGDTTTKLSIRTTNIDSRVLSHEIGWWGAPAGMIIGTKTAHPLSFGTNATSRMTIDKDGKVGIGTPSPVTYAKLDVQGGGLNIGGTGNLDAAIHVKSSYGVFERLLQMNPTGASKPGLNLLASTNAASNHQWWVWGVDVDNKWKIQPGTSFSGTTGLFIDSSGNVGIGIVGIPGARLHVEATNRPTIMAQGNFGGLMSGAGGGHGVFGTNLYIDSGNQLRTASAHTGGYGYSGMHATWGNINFYARDGNTFADAAITPASRLFIRGSDGNVGIGTTNPGEKLDVSGTIRLYGKNAFQGHDTYLRINQDGAFTSGTHFAFRANFYRGITTGDWWGVEPGVGNLLVQGNVGIGTTGMYKDPRDQTAKLTVNGPISFMPGGHQVMMTNTPGYLEYCIDGKYWGVNIFASSKRFKTNITELELDSGKIYDLVPVSFNWIAERGGKRDFGLIAEEVEKLLPLLVNYDDKGKAFSVKYDLLSVLLLNELKLKNIEIGTLKVEMEQFKARLTKLESVGS